MDEMELENLPEHELETLRHIAKENGSSDEGAIIREQIRRKKVASG